MLDIRNYIGNSTLWNGIRRFIQTNVQADASNPEITELLLSSAVELFEKKEYQTFRRAMSSLKNGKNSSLQNENLYRLLFVLLSLPIEKNEDLRNQSSGEIRAQNLLTVYLGQNELSVRSMNEFIILSALKIGMNWKETLEIRQEYASAIANSPNAPLDPAEGQTDEFYVEVLEKMETKDDILTVLQSDFYRSFFAKTRNTQYLALFPDGCSDRITDQYYAIFSMNTETDDYLTVEEIRALSKVFGNVFMTFDTFCKLVNRTSITEISGETYLLSILDLPEIEIDFLDYKNFREEVNDFLTFQGFPNLNPEVHSFDRLFFDVYEEIYEERTSAEPSRKIRNNDAFCQQFSRRLGQYLHLIAQSCLSEC